MFSEGLKTNTIPRCWRASSLDTLSCKTLTPASKHSPLSLASLRSCRPGCLAALSPSCPVWGQSGLTGIWSSGAGKQPKWLQSDWPMTVPLAFSFLLQTAIWMIDQNSCFQEGWHKPKTWDRSATQHWCHNVYQWCHIGSGSPAIEDRSSVYWSIQTTWKIGLEGHYKWFSV